MISIGNLKGEELKNGVWSRFYFDGDMELAKNIYEYFNIQSANDDYLVWFEDCIKKYNLEKNKDYFTFINYTTIDNTTNATNGYIAHYEDTDYILMFSEKSYNLIDSLNQELIKDKKNV